MSLLEKNSLISFECFFSMTRALMSEYKSNSKSLPSDILNNHTPYVVADRRGFKGLGFNGGGSGIRTHVFRSFLLSRIYLSPSKPTFVHLYVFVKRIFRPKNFVVHAVFCIFPNMKLLTSFYNLLDHRCESSKQIPHSSYHWVYVPF